MPQAQTVLDLIQAGGWPMWLLAVALLGMLYFGWSGLQSLSPGAMAPDAVLGEVTQLLARGESAKAVKLLQRHDTVLTRVMVPVLARDSRGRAELEEQVTTNLRAEHLLLLQPVSYLNMVAAIAPMLGLFGTVWGMIGAFGTISQGGMGNAQLMAGDISLGLITTAGGLLIAVPSVVLHWVLRNLLQRRMLEVARTCGQLIEFAAGARAGKPADAGNVEA